MVATRRGVRVSSPAKTNPEQRSEVQATPSTARRTRRTTKQAESPTHDAVVESCSQLEQSAARNSDSPSTTMKKRCSRASRLHSPEQPSTPVSSVHEADVSEVESCCSLVFDTEPPVTRTRGRRQIRKVNKEKEEISEAESCSSAVSASKRGQRSVRKKAESSDAASVEVEDVKADLALETESCSSVVSDSQRATRTQRKARTRSSAKPQTGDSELSDADSCISSVSGADVSKSTTRRATRSRKKTSPIPMHLDEPSGRSLSPAPTRRQTRVTRGKATATAELGESLSCDSEGFESKPAYSLTNRRSRRTRSTTLRAMDSDSDAMDVHSQVGTPSSTRARGTPCSSRTGSGNSSRGAPASRRSAKDCSVVVENAAESAEESSTLNDSKLESTLITEDADETLVDEDESQMVEDHEGVNITVLSSTKADRKKETDFASEDSHASPSEPVSEPAVVSKNQQEEPSAENKDEDMEMEVMQETVPSPERLKPCQSVLETTHERALETTEEAKETQKAVDLLPPLPDESVDDDVVVESRPSVGEEMEGSTLKSQQVVESIQVTSNQQHKVTAGSDSEPEDVIVEKKTAVCLLDSSEEEEEEEEEREVSEEEDSEYRGKEERGGGICNKSEAEAASVEGLFMIDKRPGLDADELYYKEERWEEATSTQKVAKQEEQDEEFVDEAGDEDEDDDDDAKVLFSSRNFLVKEMSSRIDPGLKVKELGGLYISFDGSKSKPVSSSLQKLKEKKIQDEVMKKSVIGPDFEKKDAVPPYSESKRALKLKRRAEREKSTGDGWFNMKAPEITQELKGDLQVLKMRGSLDPKRFYKKNDRDGFPKYFQVGTVVDNAADFYHSRVPKKERKRTIVEELLADAEFRQKNKKRYQQVMAEQAAQEAGKKNKKKNKFHKK